MKIRRVLDTEDKNIDIHTKQKMNLHVSSQIDIKAHATVIKTSSGMRNIIQKNSMNDNQKYIDHTAIKGKTSQLKTRKRKVFSGNKDQTNREHEDYYSNTNKLQNLDQKELKQKANVLNQANIGGVTKTIVKESVLNNIEGSKDVYDASQIVKEPVLRTCNIAKDTYRYTKARRDYHKQKKEAKEKVYYIRGGKKVEKETKIRNEKDMKINHVDSKETYQKMKQENGKAKRENQETIFYKRRGNDNNTGQEEKGKQEKQVNKFQSTNKNKRKENKAQYRKLKKQRITKYAMTKVRSTSNSESQSSESDSIGNLIKDLSKMRLKLMVKQITVNIAALILPIIGPIVCFGFILLVAVTALYESPLAIFLPKIEPCEYDIECDDERSPQEVIEEYCQELDAEIAEQYASYDEYSITYLPEDSFVGSNTKDILYAYMIECGEDNDSLVMTDDNKRLLKDIFTTMCSYETETSTRTVTVENNDEEENTSGKEETNLSQDKENTSDSDEPVTKTISVIDVKVQIHDLEDYINDNPLTSEENEWYITLMEEDPNDFSDDEETNLDGVTVDGIPSEIGTQVAELALTKVGCDYSQSRRWEEGIYDCSSLVYRCYQQYGITLGASTAAGEAKWLTEKQCYFTSSDKLQAGDLIFYSSDTDNGRYRNISHVAIYIGNGKQVEAQNPSKGVRCNTFRASNINCYARPSLLLEGQE